MENMPSSTTETNPIANIADVKPFTEGFEVDTSESTTQTPEAEDNKSEKRKGTLKRLGGVALASVVTYGAMKAGYLDSIPAVADMAASQDQLGMITGSLMAGSVVSEVGRTIKSSFSKRK